MEPSVPDVESIFCAALEILLPEERARFLDGACGNNIALRQRVERLLAAVPKAAGSFLESPPAELQQTADSAPIQERPGTVIGRYKLLEQIGAGGFGVVFMAQQLEPVRRKVALKIIKPGMDSKEVIARFEAERQAYAEGDKQLAINKLAGATYDSAKIVRALLIADSNRDAFIGNESANAYLSQPILAPPAS